LQGETHLIVNESVDYVSLIRVVNVVERDLVVFGDTIEEK